MIFSSQKNYKMIFSVARNTMFTDYGKDLVLNFSEMGNTVLFWAKTLMKKRYLLRLFELSMILQNFGNMVSCALISLWWWYFGFNISCAEYKVFELVFPLNKSFFCSARSSEEIFWRGLNHLCHFLSLTSCTFSVVCLLSILLRLFLCQTKVLNLPSLLVL